MIISFFVIQRRSPARFNATPCRYCCRALIWDMFQMAEISDAYQEGGQKEAFLMCLIQEKAARSAFFTLYFDFILLVSNLWSCKHWMPGMPKCLTWLKMVSHGGWIFCQHSREIMPSGYWHCICDITFSYKITNIEPCKYEIETNPSYQKSELRIGLPTETFAFRFWNFLGQFYKGWEGW